VFAAYFTIELNFNSGYELGSCDPTISLNYLCLNTNPDTNFQVTTSIWP